MSFKFNKAGHTSVMKLLTKLFSKTTIVKAIPPKSLPAGALRFEYIDRDLNSAQEAMDWICDAQDARTAGIRLRLILENKASLQAGCGSLSSVAYSKFTVDFINGFHDRFFLWWRLFPVQDDNRVFSTMFYGKREGYIPFYESDIESQNKFIIFSDAKKMGHYSITKIAAQEIEKFLSEGTDEFAKKSFKERFFADNPKDAMVLIGKSVIALYAWHQEGLPGSPGSLMCLGYDWVAKTAVVMPLDENTVKKVISFKDFKGQIKQKIMNDWIDFKIQELLF